MTAIFQKTASRTNRKKNNLNSRKNFFKLFSFFTLCFTLGVILWGAWVRFSHSGDGCGNNWPLCKGDFSSQDSAALIEWIHRATSGFSFLLVTALLVLALKIYPKKHFIRKCALVAFGLIIVEALIGAGLVLASLTGSNSSSLRAGVLAFHLLNSLFLVGSLVFCWQGALFSKVRSKKTADLFYAAIPSPGSYRKLSLSLQHSLPRIVSLGGIDFGPATTTYNPKVAPFSSSFGSVVRFGFSFSVPKKKGFSHARFNSLFCSSLWICSPFGSFSPLDEIEPPFYCLLFMDCSC